MSDETPHNGPDELAPASGKISWLASEGVQLRMYEETSKPMSVVTLFRGLVEKRPQSIALVDTYYNDQHEIYTYNKYYESVVHVAKAFLKLGLETRHGVGILGFNSPHWFISHLASIFAGGLSVGIYATNSAETCHYIANNSKCNIIVVEDDKQLQKILKVKDRLPHLKYIIQYRGQPKENYSNVYAWQELMEMNVDAYTDELQKRIKGIAPNKCCALIYTSGTTGEPKGVMLSHDNVIWTIKVVVSYVNQGRSYPPDDIVSYLPLSHIAALFVDLYWPIVTGGGTTYFARPDALKGTLLKTMKEARPTIFFGVPRVWEKMMSSMVDASKNSYYWKQVLLDWFREFGYASNINALNGQERPWYFGIVKSFVFERIRLQMGLERCRFMVSGAAPIKRDILEYFFGFDLPIMEVYGLSESSGPHTLGVDGHFKLGSVGKEMPGVRTKIRETGEDGDGEICMDGRHVFMGYLGDEAKTKETFDEDGYLLSGDIGRFDDDGYMHVTGRIKELLITAGGENVAPVPIECNVIKRLPCISNCMLIGDKRKFLSILLTFKTEVDRETGESKDELSQPAIDWCRQVGSQAVTLSDILNNNDPSIANAIQKGIDDVNRDAISRAQCIQKWTILQKDFSITGGELGPTLKLRRIIVAKKYHDIIEKLYAESNGPIR